jgi:hypothetical protein
MYGDIDVGNVQGVQGACQFHVRVEAHVWK